jgi:uncharacterized protein with HEPN domain
MSQHDDNVSMQQMLDHAKEAVSMSRDRTHADLETDRMLQLALTRLLEIEGEAAGCVGFRASTQSTKICLN